MAKWPNHFISGKQFQKGQIWQIWHTTHTHATIPNFSCYDDIVFCFWEESPDWMLNHNFSHSISFIWHILTRKALINLIGQYLTLNKNKHYAGMFCFQPLLGSFLMLTRCNFRILQIILKMHWFIWMHICTFLSLFEFLSSI